MASFILPIIRPLIVSGSFSSITCASINLIISVNFVVQVSAMLMFIAPIIDPDAPTTANVIIMMLISVKILISEVRTELLNLNVHALLFVVAQLWQCFYCSHRHPSI
eukprot:2268011-Heterocapsa_arctica.AAC.1